MAKISSINIPVTVDPTGMDRGIAQAERKLRSGSERMQRAASSNVGGAVRGVATAGAGALGFGAAGGALGALGGGGLVLGAALAPFYAAAQMAAALTAATKGATDQMKRLGTEGVGSFGNQAILASLSRIEQRMLTRGERPTLAQSFLAGEEIASRRGVPTLAERMMMNAEMSALMAGALSGGASITDAVAQSAILSQGQGAAVEVGMGVMQSVRRTRRPAGAQDVIQRHADAMSALYQSNQALMAHRRMEYGL